MSALLIVGVLFITLQSFPSPEATPSTHLRVRSIVDDTDKLFEQDLRMLLEQQTRQSLSRLAQRASVTAYTNISAVQSAFQQCMQTAVCGGEQVDDSLSTSLRLYEDAYLEHLQYDTSINLVNITVVHVSPWALLVEADVEANLSDVNNWASISRTHTIITEVSIIGLPDPLTGRLGVPRRVQPLRSSHTNWDVELVVQHALEGTYLYEERGPSYLERFTANPVANPDYGIRSLLPPGTYGAYVFSYVDFEPLDDCYIIVQESPRLLIGLEYAFDYNMINPESLASAIGSDCPG
jgi:hypothetical protein